MLCFVCLFVLLLFFRLGIVFVAYCLSRFLFIFFCFRYWILSFFGMYVEGGILPGIIKKCIYNVYKIHIYNVYIFRENFLVKTKTKIKTKLLKVYL